MISTSQITLAIIMMALITFLVRYAFFTTSLQIELHPKFKRLLVFTAPCILTAMVIPIMFQHGLTESNKVSLITSSYFWGSLLAIILSFFVRHTLFIIIFSMIGFFLMRYLGLD